MRRKMEKLAKKFEGTELYFTEAPNDNLDLDGNKYFLCWTGTGIIAKSWKTQADAVEGMEYIVENGLSTGNGMFFIDK